MIQFPVDTQPRDLRRSKRGTLCVYASAQSIKDVSFELMAKQDSKFPLRETGLQFLYNNLVSKN